MFVSCAQQLNDVDQLRGMQAIALFSDAEFREFNRIQKDIKGVDGALAHFQSQAACGWLDVCKQTLDSVRDPTKLELCGLLLRFSNLKLNVDSPLVCYQDGLARTLCFGAFRLCRNRIGSMLQHSYYPLSLAGLLNPNTRDECIKKFGVHVFAWWGCKDWVLTLA
jgi:hypothetical protein